MRLLGELVFRVYGMYFHRYDEGNIKKPVLCFAVHETGGVGDLHPVPGQLEIREEGDKNNVPSETGLCTISRGTLQHSTIRCIFFPLFSLSFSLSLSI